MLVANFVVSNSGDCDGQIAHRKHSGLRLQATLTHSWENIWHIIYKGAVREDGACCFESETSMDVAQGVRFGLEKGPF